MNEEKIPQQWVFASGGRRGDQAKCCADGGHDVFRAFDPKRFRLDKFPARVGLFHSELAARDLPFVVVESDAMCVEEGGELLPDMVDAVGCVAPEKPTLFVHLSGTDLLRVEIETIGY